jgi:hypothetical protein
MAAKYYRTQKPTSFVSADAVQNLIVWSGLEEYLAESKVETNLPEHTYFDDMGIIISRGQQALPFSIAIKAGHNAENHNHMDVGTYVLVFDEDYPAGDIGAPSYTAGAFDDDNPARSSWGHPVPRINNTLQSKGIEFRGEVLETEFSAEYDKVVMDIKPAYEVDGLETLVRTMENNKKGDGQISIKDEFSASNTVSFGTAISTFSSYEIVDASTIVLTSVNNNEKVKVEINCEGGKVKITPEPVPVEHLRSGKNAKRIGIDFVEKIQKGSITVTYKPILN